MKGLCYMNAKRPGMGRAALGAVTIIMLLTNGCGTLDGKNSASRPWNRPTKAEMARAWGWGYGWGELPQWDSISGSRLSDYP
jgi:hypothetical protein